MKKKTTLGVLAAIIVALASWTAAQAAPKECKGSPNAAACDFDGDGVANRDDDDIDGDGTANADDRCERDATDTCEEEGGEDPGTTPDPTTLLPSTVPDPFTVVDPGTVPVDPTTLVPTVDPGTLPDPTTLVPTVDPGTLPDPTTLVPPLPPV